MRIIFVKIISKIFVKNRKLVRRPGSVHLCLLNECQILYEKLTNISQLALAVFFKKYFLIICLNNSS
jgi:hypothetical protein